jgi:thioester reductase-like protein
MAPPSIARNPIELVEWWECPSVDTSFLPTPIAEIALDRAHYPAQLRTLLTGGDRLRHAPPPSQTLRLVNNYGPTETTVVATSGRIEAGDAIVHIGRPIANTQIYILDGYGAPVPVGVAGELYIGGAGVSRGYLKRADLTAERFVADPFAKERGARMYRTGDLGRWRSDGNIEFVGRNDSQVKIRGFRIELGEIEARLNEQAGVREAVVVARGDSGGDQRLVAYYTGEVIGAEELRGQLAASLPQYMVPAAYVHLEALPLTPNGKLDRAALPAPDADAYASRGYEPPQGEVEEQLAAIWSDLLKIDRVGRHDNFFELGGHSLLAVALIERLRQQGLQTDVRTLFGAPTLSRLAAALGQSTVETYVELAETAILPNDIQPLAALPAAKPNRILLTGATGFVGRFLLREFLDQGAQRVVCILRCTDPKTGFERLHQTLKHWSLWRPGDEDRIEVFPGDLSAPRLGLSEANYRRVCDEPDVICHNATSMNHLETFETARKTNVDGVTEVLRIVACGRPKTLNYVSTLSVFNTIGYEGVRQIDEFTPIESERHLSTNGYASSKWVGEQLVQLAMRRGVPCNVYRLGLITGDTELGRYDEQQTFHRLLESCIRIGAGFEKSKYDLLITPVDYVARALVRLGNDHSRGGNIFHLSSMTATPIETVFTLYNQVAQPPLAILSLREWLDRIREHSVAGETLPILPLVHSFLNMDERTLEAFMAEHEQVTISFDCTHTQSKLEQAGIVMPPFNAYLMSTYLQGMLIANPKLNALVDMALVDKNILLPI